MRRDALFIVLFAAGLLLVADSALSAGVDRYSLPVRPNDLVASSAPGR